MSSLAQGEAGKAGNNGEMGFPGSPVRSRLTAQLGSSRDCLHSITDTNFIFQGARGFPGMPGPPGLKGHRVSIYPMLLSPIFTIVNIYFLPLYFAVFSFIALNILDSVSVF